MHGSEYLFEQKTTPKEWHMMKKALPIFAMIFLLAGCSLPGMASTPSDADMATRVAQILTSMPENQEAASVSPTAVIQQPTPVVITLPPVETSTLEPSQTPTATLESTAALTQTPTVVGTSTQTPLPSFTMPPGDPRQRLGTPSSTDSMDNADTWGWPLGPSEFSNMEFRDGSLVLTGLKDVSGWRLPIRPAFANLYIEMTARAGNCTGLDSYGIIFRVPVFNEADRGYLFEVSCDGRYKLWKWDGKVEPNGKATVLISWRPNPAIQPGPNQVNRLGVMSVDDRIILYANGMRLDEVRDNAYPVGYFGVFINPDKTAYFTIAVDEMSYWENPAP